MNVYKITCVTCGAAATSIGDGPTPLCGLCGGSRTAELVTKPHNEARTRLRTILPHLQIAAEMAKIEVPDGEVKLSIAGMRADGTGRNIASFEAAEFLADLEAVLGGDDGEG